jgi:TM2 domain-containing membrane protein YozV
MPDPLPRTAEPTDRRYSPVYGFLSYLVPGLGQICQGRTGKGVLFLVCLYGLFFFGMYLGSWSNVYLPDTADGNNPWRLPDLAANVFNRPQFAGQFWIGVAAWPALWQYHTFDRGKDSGPLFGRFERAPLDEREINDLQRKGDKNWDLAWVYTVIAGVLNILVIYDAAAGPALAAAEEADAESARSQGEASPA